MGEISKNSKVDYVEYFLIFSVIAFSGFEYFYRSILLYYILIFPVALYFFYRNKDLIVSGALVQFMFLIYIWSTFQVFLGVMDISNQLILLIRFFCYYAIASIVLRNFCDKYVKIVYFLSCVSIVAYLLMNISSSIYDFLILISRNIKSLNVDPNFISSNPCNTLILFIIPHTDIYRNSGPFWEPGMFGVFINIALIIRLSSAGRILDKKVVVFILASLTTFSTTSFFATLMILILYSILIKHNVKAMFFLIVLLLAIVPVLNSDLIAGKIESNLDNADKSWSRFGAFLLHLSIIKEHPLLGVGFVSDSSDGVAPNGISNIFAVYGVPLALLFYFLWYKTARILFGGKMGRLSFILYMTLLIVAFSQDITTRHFYYVLLMFPLVKYNTNRVII